MVEPPIVRQKLFVFEKGVEIVHVIPFGHQKGNELGEMKILSRSGGFPNEVETGCEEHLLESAASRLRVLIRRTDIVKAISGIWGIHSFDRDHDIFQPLGSGSGFDARDDRGFNRVMDGIGNRPFRVLSYLLTDNLAFIIHPKIEDSSARFIKHRGKGNDSFLEFRGRSFECYPFAFFSKIHSRVLLFFRNYPSV